MLALALLLGALASRQIGSHDLGFHLAAGEYLLSGAGWPAADPFTFTVPDHPYVDTSWGYQVLVALVQRIGGAAGIVLFHLLLAAGTFGLVWRTMELGPRAPAPTVALLGLGILAAEIRFDTRPEMLSYLLLALVLYLLHRHAHGRSSPLWMLPCIHLLWANAHSLFILGWAALAAFLAGTALRERGLDRRLALWSAISLPVVLVNPYGLGALSFLGTLATRLGAENPFATDIGDLLSVGQVLSRSDYPRLSLWSFLVVTVLFLLSVVGSIRQRRFERVLLLGYLPLSWAMIRNVPIAVIAALPVVVWAAAWLRDRGRRAVPEWLSGAVIGVVLVLAVGQTLRVVHDAHYIADRREARFGLGWNPQLLPVTAADFIQRRQLDAPPFNELGFGGYLIWRLGAPVFIDGRLEVMGEPFYREYRRILIDDAAFDAAVGRYGIRWLVFRPWAYRPLLLRLLGRARWSLVYLDPTAVIFVDRGLGPSSTPEPSLALYFGPPIAPGEAFRLPGLGSAPRRGAFRAGLDGLLRRQRYPTRADRIGRFHMLRGDPARAAAWFARGIRESAGAYPELYYRLGTMLLYLERYEEARACFGVVLEANPADAATRERLAELERAVAR